MSNNISEGYKTNCDFYTLNYKCKQLKEDIYPISTEVIFNDFVKNFFYWFDKYHIFQSYREINNELIYCFYFLYNYNVYYNKENIKKIKNMSLYELLFFIYKINNYYERYGITSRAIKPIFIDLSFYPLKDKILIIPSYSENKYKPVLKKYFDLYHYWDNTDPDPEISDHEWEKRRHDWNNLDIYDKGFEFQVIDFLYNPINNLDKLTLNNDIFENYKLNKDERIYKIALNYLVSNEYEKSKKYSYSYLIELKDYFIKNNEGKKIFEEKKEEFKEKIPDDINKNTFKDFKF